MCREKDLVGPKCRRLRSLIIRQLLFVTFKEIVYMKFRERFYLI